jgi:hypothetical protein
MMVNLRTIPVERFVPKIGTIGSRIFENRSIKIGPLLLYDLIIPLEPFDSGLNSEENPVETNINLEYLELPVQDWRHLDGQSFKLDKGETCAAIYLGGAHNPVTIEKLQFKRLNHIDFHINCELYCDFKSQGVGKNGAVNFETDVKFLGMFLDLDAKNLTPSDLKYYIAKVAEPTAYLLSEQTLVNFTLVPPIPSR